MKNKVRITFLDRKLAKKYEEADREFIRNPRPCLFLVRLKYCNKYQDFAVPIRSNLNPLGVGDYYFELPPRPTTREDRVHALQYTKMFPIARRFLTPYKFTNYRDEINVKNTILENFSLIVSGCQRYLEDYEKYGETFIMCTDIDRLLVVLENELKNIK